MKKILFICRASIKDGLGHVMRCSTVISAFSKSHHISLLVIGDEVGANVLNGARFEYEIIGDDKQIIPFATKLNPDLVVFDLIKIEFENLNRGGRTGETGAGGGHARMGFAGVAPVPRSLATGSAVARGLRPVARRDLSRSVTRPRMPTNDRKMT